MEYLRPEESKTVSFLNVCFAVETEPNSKSFLSNRQILEEPTIVITCFTLFPPHFIDMMKSEYNTSWNPETVKKRYTIIAPQLQKHRCVEQLA